MDHYILIDSKPVSVPLEVWSGWFETADRKIANTVLTPDIHVSTVFLGLDHGYFSSVPILFETMVFGGNYDEEQRRYATLEEAQAGHEEMVERVKKSLPKKKPVLGALLPSKQSS